MSDIGADVFAEWGVVPENVVPLSVFSVVSRGWLVVECIGIRIRRYIYFMYIYIYISLFSHQKETRIRH